MSFNAIFYREREIAIANFQKIFLSYISNAIFFIAIFLVFKGYDFFKDINLNDFALISYIRIVVQTQIYSQIYSIYDSKEKIFQYELATYKLRLQSFFSRLAILIFFNLLSIIFFYLWTSFKFSSLKEICLFILSIIIMIANQLALNFLISRNSSFLNYIIQILLLPMNLGALMIILNKENQFLIVFVTLLSIVNVLLSCWVDRVKT